MERPQGWLNMAEFDPTPGGPFAATYRDGLPMLAVFALVPAFSLLLEALK